MQIRSWITATTVPLVCVSLAGCGNPALTSAAKMLPQALSYVAASGGAQDPMTLAHDVADAQGWDYPHACLHHPLIDAIRAQKAANAPSPNGQGGVHANVHSAKADTQLLGFFSDAVAGKTSGYHVLSPQFKTLSSRISGFQTSDGLGDFIWIAEDGEVFMATPPAGPAYAFTITDKHGNATSDTFTDAYIALGGPNYNNKTNTDMFVISDSGTLYVVDPFNLHNDGLPGDTNTHTADDYAMGQADSRVGHNPGAWPDYAATTGSTNTVYAITNKGTLYKFVVNFNTKTIASTQSASLQTNYAGSTSYTELFATPPVIFNHQLAIGSWVLFNGTNRSFDRGSFYAYKLSSFSGTLPYEYSDVDGAPFLVPPSPVLDNSLNIAYALEPDANHVDMFDVESGPSGQVASSLDLTVNNIDPVSGNLTQVSGTNSAAVLRSGIANQVTFNESTNSMTAYVTNCNALWKLSFASSYDSTSNPFVNTTSNFNQRAVNFQTPTETTYAKSFLGEKSTTDSSGHYVYNNCTPTVTDFNNLSTFDIIDSTGNLNHSTDTSLNRFQVYPTSATTPPSLISHTDLALSGTEAAASQYSGPFISDDGITETYSTQSATDTAPAGAAWSQ